MWPGRAKGLFWNNFEIFDREPQSWSHVKDVHYRTCNIKLLKRKHKLLFEQFFRNILMYNVYASKSDEVFSSVRAEKRTSQLSAHLQYTYLRAQFIIQAAMVLQWLETAADFAKVREDVAQLIYCYYLSKHDFFRHFTVRKTRPPLPAARLYCSYIQWCAWLLGLWKKCLHTEISWIPRGKKGF